MGRIIFIFVFILYSFVLGKEKFDLNFYELMYKSFIYSNDIKSAYDVSKKVVNKIPFNIKWRKRIAKLSLWLGKNEEAFKHYLYIYEKTNDKEAEKVLFNFPYPIVIDMKIKRYEKDIQKGNYTKVFELAKLYKYKGYPEKSLKVLENVYNETKNKKILDEYLKYAIDLGKVDILTKHVKELRFISSKHKYTAAYYFIIFGKYNEAWEVLRYVDKLPDNKNYYSLLIYILLKTKNYEELLKLLKFLFVEDKLDISYLYLLLNYYYENKDYKTLEYLLRKSVKKYENKDLIKFYIDILITNKKYKKALTIIKKHKNLFTEKKYLLLLSQIYTALNKKEKLAFIYEKLLQKFANQLTTDEKRYILWFFIDNIDKYYTVLKKYLPLLEGEKELYTEIINIYIILQETDKAFRIANKLIKSKRNDLLFLISYADILNQKAKNEESKYYYQLAWKLAIKEAKYNPSVLYKKEFLINYIRLAIMFSSYKKVENLLNIAKKVLPLQQYINLKIDYYLYTRNFEPAFYIYNYKRLF